MLTSLTTLAVGLGALLVAGNVLLAAARRTRRPRRCCGRTPTRRCPRCHSPAVMCVVRRTPNDATLDRRSWVLDGQRVVERPAGASRAARPGRGRARTHAAGGGGQRARRHAAARRARLAPGTRRPAAAVVVALSTESLERLQAGVLIGSIVIAALVLLAGGARDPRRAERRAASRRADDRAAPRTGARTTSTAASISGRPRDELTGLAATLDVLLARIAASRRHEQRFASEVAHELRTPLAGLRLRAELALRAAGPTPTPSARTPSSGGRRARRAVDRAIDALLAVARQEIDPASGTVDLAAIAREFDGVTVSAPAGLPVAEGDPEVVRRALAPLVDNARRHAREAVRARTVERRREGPPRDPRRRPRPRPASESARSSPVCAGPTNRTRRRRSRLAARASPGPILWRRHRARPRPRRMFRARAPRAQLRGGARVVTQSGTRKVAARILAT